MSGQIDLSLEQQAQSTWNRVWFAWRQFRRAQRASYCEQAEPKTMLFADRADSQHWDAREAELRERYGLNDAYQRTTQRRYLEILTHLDFLEQLLPDFAPGDNASWLDIGAKNWSYVDALHGFLNHSASGSLTGIEIDAYRLYPDWHSRMDYAQHYAEPLTQTTYLAGDLMTHQAKYDVISWFLPFVFLSPCLSWGLPADCFNPTAQLQHAFGLLKPDGTLVIVNQGEVEFQEQGRLLTQLQATEPSLEIIHAGPLEESFLTYRYPRYGWQIRKQA